MGKQPVPPGTVKDTGAEPGDVLLGIRSGHNTGLLIQILERQARDTPGPIQVPFLVLHEGIGYYSSGLRAVTKSRQSFRSAEELIDLVRKEEGCKDCTHMLNANCLWKLDVEKVNAHILKGLAAKNQSEGST